MKSRMSYAYPGYDVKIFVKWYQEIMKKEGYVTSFIVAFKDGEKLEF